MKLNGVELEFNFYDADQMEIFEDALDKAGEEIQIALDKQGKQSQMIRGICQATINLLDDVFGEGTAKDVFQGETDFRKCLDVFTTLVKEKARQEEEISKTIEEMELLTNKNQQPNRTIRRASRKS